MQKNAFELLRSGGRRYSQSQGQSQKQHKKRRSSAEQQGSYSSCPVCGDSSIPTWHLEQHVASCLEKPATQNAAQDKTGTAKKRRHAATGVPVPVAAAPASLPLPEDSLATARAAEGHTPAGAAQTQQHAAADAKAATADGTVNAFAVITKGQAAQAPLEATMFLEACSDGSWLCHWWNKGSTAPKPDLNAAWTASTNVNLPKQQPAASAGSTNKGSISRQSVLDIPAGSTKLVLQLATNLPSGYGTAMDWSNPLLPSNGSQIQQQQQREEDQEQHRRVKAENAAGASGKSKGLSLLISALQKCIRRGRAASAIRIALHLLKEPDGPRQLLRRLSIICLEDGLLHPQVPLVVWAMMAESKGYVIGGSLANALLSITYQMATVGHRDFMPDAEDVQGPSAAIYNAPRTWQSIDAALPTASWESLLIKCILIRAGYGGMVGDREMLLRFAGLWLARFTGTTLEPPVLPQPAATAASAAAAGGGGKGNAGQLAAGKADEGVEQQQGQQRRQQDQQQQEGYEAGDDAVPEVQRPLPAADRIHQQQQQPYAITALAEAKQVEQQPGILHKHNSEPSDAAAALTALFPAQGGHPQQHQQLQQQQGIEQLFCGRDSAICFADAPTAVSPWLQFLQKAYAALPRPGEVHLSTHVTSLGPLNRPQNTDVVPQDDKSTVPKAADLDVESLGNQLEAFITRQTTKLIKQAKELLPGALEAAIKSKVQSMEKEHQTSLQQANEQAARESTQLTESFQQQLHSKDQNLASLSQKLADMEQHCASLQTTITSKQQEIDVLRAELASKNTEINKLHIMVDDAEDELNHVRCKGRELLTFQGLSTPQASQNALKVALKDLSTTCDAMVGLIRQRGLADPMIPFIIDVGRISKHQQQEQQVNMSGLRHIIWKELFETVLVEFRQSQLVVNCSISSKMHDPEALVLQLQLEKKLADHWLKLTTASTSNSAAEAATDKYTNTFLNKLLGNRQLLIWNVSSDPTSTLTPAARQVVAAAMKVQIIASAMHSQLIRVIVPGWLQDTVIPASPAVPASQWPGVVPLSKDWMQAGAALPAAAFALPKGIDAAAVLCQEPAVVQLAERVNDLAEFGGQPQQGAYKVLLKARMVVARCM